MFVSLLRNWPSKELTRAKLLFSSLKMQLKMVIKSDPMGYNCKKSYVQMSKLSGTLCMSERCKKSRE
jgi:hypothetical protein